MEWKKEKLKLSWKMNKERLLFLFCSGLLLFILSVPNGGKPDKKAESAAPAGAAAAAGESDGAKGGSTYEKELEDRIRDILSHVDGVGETDVMVVLKSSEEKVLRVDKNVSSTVTEEKAGDGEGRTTRQQEQSENTVLNGNGSDSGPIVEKELRPELSGIVISADGGGSAVIKAEISEAMEALFGLPPHKIKVLKRVVQR